MAKSITDVELKERITELVNTSIDNGEITESNCHELKTRTDVITKFMAETRDEIKTSRPKCNKVFSEIINAHFGPAEATTKPDEPEKQEPKPKQTRAAAPKQPKKSIDDLVESDEPVKPVRNTKNKTETVGKSTPRTTQRSRLVYARCNGLSINNPSSAFNIAELVEPGEFSEEVVDVKEAEAEFLETFLTTEQVEEYNTASEEFIDAVNQLYEAYPVDDPKGKKHQHFTVVKSGMNKKNHTVKVKFVDPQSEKLTQAELPDDDTTAFYEHEVFMETFAKTLKSALKPAKKSKDEQAKLTKEQKAELAKKAKLQPLEYLLLRVVNTQNIIKTDFFVKLPEVRNEDVVKLTNTIREPISEADIRSLCNQLKSEAVFAPDYCTLFTDIKNFNGSNYGRLVKAIYNHRVPLLNHSKLTRELKEQAWLEALGNLASIESTIPNDTESKLVYDCWINVLESKFAFYIVMCNAPPNEYFKKGFELLIQHPLSIKLYESALYPISFIFTPNMLGFNDYEPNVQKCFNTTEATYKKNIVGEWLKFGTASTKHYDYNECAWLFYFNKTDLVNQMVSLLHQSVAMLDKPEPKPRASKATKAAKDDEEQ